MRWRAAEVALWVALALALVAPSLRAWDDLPGDGVDLYGTIWFFWWIRDCLTTGADPSWTPYFFYPFGKDVFGHTGNNFVDAVLSLPLQVLFGTPGYYKWWVVVVFLSNAIAFRFLARDEIPDRFAAAAATVLYAVNPYLLYELQCGRPTQAMTCFVLASYFYLRRLDRGWRDAVACGVAVGVTGWTYWYYAFFFLFSCAWFVPATLWDHPDRRRYLRGLAIAAVVAAIVVAPAVVPMAIRDVAGTIPGIERGHGWLELPVTKSLPNGPTLQGYVLWEPEGARFLQSPVWAALALAWVALSGRVSNARRWLGVAAVGLGVAVGLSARIFGHRVWWFPYLLLYDNLPFFDRLWFPYRALVLVFIALSMAAGAMLAAVAAGGGDRARWVARVAAPVLVVGSLAMSWSDCFFPLVSRSGATPAAYRWMAESGGALIDLPRGIAQTQILFQPAHRLPLLGGMGENVALFFPPGHRRLLKNPFVTALTRAGRNPADASPFQPRDRDAIEALGFRWVVLHRELVDSEFNRASNEIDPREMPDAPFAITRRLTNLLGDPVAVDGPMVIWSLSPGMVAPEAIRPSAQVLWQRGWERPEPAAYETRMYEVGRLGRR
jgi:hypothetical protein